MTAKLDIVFLFATIFSGHLTESKIDPLKRRVLGETHVAEPTWLCIQRMKAEKTWKTINSPGFPKGLDMKNSRCTWKIAAPKKQRVRVAFRTISLATEDPAHCSSNYLEIIDEFLGKSQVRMCGRKAGGDIVSQGNKLRLDLQRDPSENYQRGFSISFMATSAKAGFYSKKTFNDPKLPPLKKNVPKELEKKAEKKTKKKGEAENKLSGVPILTADGKLILVPEDSVSTMSKRQISSDTNNRKFKSLGGGSGTNSSGMSTLMIVGIVVGCLVGVLIIFLILRFFVFKKKKNRNNGEITTNSGMPKINMSHDGVLSAKKKILEPAKLLHENRHSYPPRHDPPSYSEENRSPSPSSSSPSDEGTDVPDEDKRNYRIRSQRQRHIGSQNSPDDHHDRGRQNGGFQHHDQDRHPVENGDLGYRDVGQNNRQRTHREREASLSPHRKVPYRYNSGAGPRGWEDREAIEALNKEQFCGDGSGYVGPQNKRSGTRETRTQSMVQKSPKRGQVHARHADRDQGARRPVDRQISEPIVYPLKHAGRNPSSFSDFSEVSSFDRRGQNDDRKKSYTADRVTSHRNFMLPGDRQQNRERETNGLHRDLQGSRELSGRKRGNGWSGAIDHPPHSKHKKGETIPEEFTQNSETRRKSRKRKEEIKTEMRLIDNRDLNDPNKKGGSGRFAPAPPSPTLPRHVVPSSRKQSHKERLGSNN